MRLELRKLMRSGRPLVAGFSLVVFLLLMLIGFYTYAKTETGGSAEFRYTFENQNYFNGLTFALYTCYFGVSLLLPIFASIEGASQIAGERASGTLSLLLTRPVSRSRLFLTKAMLSIVFLVALVGVFMFVTLVVGLFAVGWGDLDLYPGVMQMTDRPQHLTQGQALVSFLLAWPAIVIALLPSLGLSVLVSTWSRSALNAMGVSVSLYLVFFLISQVHFFRDLRPFLFTSYIVYWRALFQASIDWAAISRDGAKVLAYSALFLGLAHYRFRTREEL